MNLEEQYHAEGMPRKIERVEAERDNAWTELREIRAAISANPEESTLDEVVNLRQQLADAQKQIVELHAEVERKMSAASFLIAEHNEQLAAKDDEIRELVTSDNKVVADLSRYVETLEQQIADRDEQISDLTISSDTYFAERNSARDVWRRASKDRDELRQQLAEAQAEVLEQARIVGMGAEREIALREQLAAFHSAVEHVTEDGCTRRSFVAMPEGWAMVHKDRLHALELAEEQLAATDGLDQYILCEKEPVVWMQSDHLSRFVHHACGAQSALVRCSDHQLMPDFQPLYRAMKVRVAREKNAKNC